MYRNIGDHGEMGNGWNSYLKLGAQHLLRLQINSRERDHTQRQTGRKETRIKDEGEERREER
jgi:hypothetical protein